MRRYLLSLLTVLASACGSNVVSEPSEVVESKIVNGFDASEPRFDAVGALAFKTPTGAVVPFCTATLVSPRVILTAKHCVIFPIADGRKFFAIGPDARRPSQLIRVVSTIMERDVGGLSVMALGSDTAVGVLETPVVGVEPLPVVAPTPADVGPDFLAIGYGRQQEPDTLDLSRPPPPATSGTRRMAPMRIRALGGARFFEAVFGTFERYFEAYVRADQGRTTDQTLLRLRARQEWERVLAPDAELLAIGAVPETKYATSSGDSGGPLLARTPMGLRVVGVTSGISFLYYPGMPHPFFSYGTVYASLGAEARALVSAAVSCLSVSTEGSCLDEGRVQRCVAANGRFQVATAPCEGNSRCGSTPEGASCLSACSDGASCGAISPGGQCSANRCSWDPAAACLGHRSEGFLACALCCQGTPNPAACVAQCLAPPVSTQVLLPVGPEARSR